MWYAADLPLAKALHQCKESSKHPDPSAWGVRTVDSKRIWLNLSDGYIGSGRKNWMAQANEAAKRLRGGLATTGNPILLLEAWDHHVRRRRRDSYAKDEDDTSLILIFLNTLLEWGST